MSTSHAIVGWAVMASMALFILWSLLLESEINRKTRRSDDALRRIKEER